MTSLQRENPPGATAGFQDFYLATDSLEATPPRHVLQARIELIREDLVNTVGGMQAALAAAVSMAAIPSDEGMLHGLRQARACWKSISELAADIGSLRAELASLLRQEGAL